jgi:UDP-N-acetylglucosamine 4,6-dehydratase
MEWRDKVILLIGGTGSFGSNFIKYFLKKHTPKRIRIYSRCEHKQAELIENTYYGGILDGFIGDVRDKDRLRRAMEGVDIVIHAAALKRVQSCEYNPFETIKTNILGSMNVVDCALDVGVDKLMAISTDKAVSPLNLYGATKMCMEKLFIHANSYRGTKKTKISCCRYGNVAGSRGSVIPIWRKLSEEGKPLTVTNANATRFWLDMEKAIDLVAESIENMDFSYGGEVFIPKIPSFKVMDLYHAFARSTSELSIIGDRIGDKLHETLVSEDEMKHAVDAGDRYIIYPQEPRWEYYKPKGHSCNGRFAYSSDKNTEFLTEQELKDKLAKLP